MFSMEYGVYCNIYQTVIHVLSSLYIHVFNLYIISRRCHDNNIYFLLKKMSIVVCLTLHFASTVIFCSCSCPVKKCCNVLS